MVENLEKNMWEALPADMLVEITSRLPLKSLINCTRVCKVWRTVISNPLMAKSDPTYFVFFDETSARLGILDLGHIEDEEVWTSPIQSFRDRDITIVGSCNGLICFRKRTKYVETIYIYNPTLGETVTVPYPKPEHHSYMFGFCPITNQYKLLAITFRYYATHTPDVSVYTLGSHQGWRHIHVGDDQHFFWRNYLCIHVCGGGDIYWKNLHTNPESISTFKLGVEELGSIPIPPIGDDKVITKLAYLDHSLIATTKPYVTERDTHFDMELWVWNHSSWTKNWALPGVNKYTDVVPTKIFGDGWILMLVNGEILYLSSTNEIRLVSPPDYLPRCLRQYLIPYTPNLVSPKELMEASLYRKLELFYKLVPVLWHGISAHYF